MYARYYTPFFGFGLVTIVAVVDVGMDLVSEQQRGQRIALGLYALALGVPGLAHGLPRMHLVPPNFSSFFKADLEIVRERVPTLVVHAHCFTDDTQRSYFDHIVPQSGEPRGRVEWLDARRCDGGANESRAHMQRFLDTTPPDRLVVLDRKDEGCTAPTLPTLPAPLVLERMGTVNVCMWKLRGVTTRAQIVDAARAVGMTHTEQMR